MSAPHILLIEDDPTESVLATRALKKSLPHLRITLLRNGKEFLDYLEASSPETDVALALMDLHMPGMGGLELLDTLADRALRPPFPVIVFSSSEDPAEIAHAYASGAAAFVTKPVAPAAYREAVQHITNFWLSTNRLR